VILVLLTKSIKYPDTFNYVSGKTDLDDDITSINRCLGLLLTTAKMELLGDPEFGCRLYEMLFDQYSDNLETQIKQEICDSIEQFEKRITVMPKDIEITHNEDTDRNSYNIKITYQIKNTTYIRDTLIYIEEDVQNG
jgi:phage baseplate assembly protein W